MQFFKLKDLLKSWSFQAASVVTVTPILDESFGLLRFIPDEHKPWLVTIAGAIIMVTRAIKQTKTKFSGEK